MTREQAKIGAIVFPLFWSHECRIMSYSVTHDAYRLLHIATNTMLKSLFKLENMTWLRES